jgi:nuclease S1
MHQPPHDEDDGDEGGNARHVIFDGRPDNLHWTWDAGPLEHITRNHEVLAEQLKLHINPQDRTEWDTGCIEDWVLEGHRLDQTVVYGGLGGETSARITSAYERQANPVIEHQRNRAGVRVAYLLNYALKRSARRTSIARLPYSLTFFARGPRQRDKVFCQLKIP